MVWIGLRTSIVVGTAINLVNQFCGVFYAWNAIMWVPFALNYCVPYLVSALSRAFPTG